MKKPILFLSLILLSFLQAKPSLGQKIKESTTTEVCGQTQIHNALGNENKEIRNEILRKTQRLEKQTQDFILNRKIDEINGRINSASLPEMTIPVVFHVFYDGIESKAVSNQNIIDNMLALNEAFAGTHNRFDRIPDYFKSRAAKSKIRFKLAKLDPEGRPTNGIVRYGHEEFALNGDTNGLRSASNWPQDKYLNVWLVLRFKNMGGALGFATLPTGITDLNKELDGITILSGFVNKDQTSTLIHEAGHYLNLLHTWGTGTNGKLSNCSKDDEVLDTPNTIGGGGRCGDVKSSCGNRDNIENYMAYSGCNLMFTKGQELRMLAALNSDVANRKNLITEQNNINTGIKDNITLNAGLYTQDKFISESPNNDGSIDIKIKINAANGATFKKTGNAILNTDYRIENLPQGITTKLAINTTETATLSFEGKALSHEKANKIDNFKIHFNDNIVQGISIAKFKSISPISIVFKDPITEHCFFEFQYLGLWPEIKKVKLNELERISSQNDAWANEYQDTHIVTVKQSEKLNITLEGDHQSNSSDRLIVWVDWNANKIYEKSERYLQDYALNSNFSNTFKHTFELNVPEAANIGKTSIRVLAIPFSAENPNIGDYACDKANSGESEEYGLIIYPANKNLVSSFEIEKDKLNTSESTKFTDLSIGSASSQITKWEWTFENGTPNRFIGKTPPKVIFNKVGEHAVTLTVTNSKGNTDSHSKYVNSKIEYCKPDNIVSYNRSYIASVKLNTLHNQTGRSTYLDLFDTKSTTLTKGKSYQLEVKTANTTEDVAEYLMVYIDWNGDSKFDENIQITPTGFPVEDNQPADSERVFSNTFGKWKANANNEFIVSRKITVPKDIDSNQVGFRVIISPYNHSSFYACLDLQNGEVEDYSINIVDDIQSVTKPVANIQNQDTQTIFTKEAIQFISNSTGTIENYTWELTNDLNPLTILEIGNANSFNHLFNTVGDFTIKLKTSNSAGETSDFVKVKVNQKIVKPVASIQNTDNQTIFTQESIQFISNSTGTIDNYAWEIVNDANPSRVIANSNTASFNHLFNTVGNFTISLKVKNSAGESSVFIKTKVEEEIIKPISSIQNPDNQTIFTENSILFTSNSSGTITNYLWEVSNDLNPSKPIKTGGLRTFNYQFNQVGNFTIRLKTSNTAGETSDIVRVRVNQKIIAPVAIIENASQKTIFTKESILFKSISTGKIDNYKWEILNDSNPSQIIANSSNESFNYQFNTIGNFTTKLSTSNTAGTSISTVKVEVIEKVIITKPITIIENPDNQTIYKEDFLLFKSISTGKIDDYKWEISNDSNPSRIVANSVNESFNYQFNTIGDFTIKLTTTNTAGESSNLVQVRVNEKLPKPTSKIQNTDNQSIFTKESIRFTSNSTGTIDSYTWEIYNNSNPSVVIKSSKTESFSYQFNETGDFTIKLKAGNSAGETSDFIQVTVTERIVKPIAAIQNIDTQTISSENSIRFVSSSTGTIDNYAWEVFDDLNPSEIIANGNTSSFDYLFKQTGNFTIKLKVNNSAGETTDIVRVKVTERIAAIISGPLNPVFKVGKKITFYSKSTGSIKDYDWKLYEGNNPTAVKYEINDSFNYEFQKQGQFTLKLKVRNSKGEENSTSINIRVLPKNKVEAPVAKIKDGNREIQKNQVLTFYSKSTDLENDTYEWEIVKKSASSEELASGSSTIFNFNFKEIGKYLVRLKIVNGSGESKDQIEVTVIDSQESKPIALINGEKTQKILKNKKLTLTHNSIGNPTKITWKVYKKDGDTDTEITSNTNSIFQYIFTEVGTYAAELIVENKNGTDSTQITIQVKEDDLPNTDEKVPVVEIQGIESPTIIKSNITFSNLFNENINKYKWTLYSEKDGKSTAIAMMNMPTFTYQFTKSGLYAIELIAENSAGFGSKAIKFEVIDPNVLSENEKTENNISTFPNPAQNGINILTNNLGTVNMIIYDAAGNEIKKKSLETTRNKIDIQNFKSGIYIIRFQFKDYIYFKKFLKK